MTPGQTLKLSPEGVATLSKYFVPPASAVRGIYQGTPSTVEALILVAVGGRKPSYYHRDFWEAA